MRQPLPADASPHTTPALIPPIRQSALSPSFLRMSLGCWPDQLFQFRLSRRPMFPNLPLVLEVEHLGIVGRAFGGDAKELLRFWHYTMLQIEVQLPHLALNLRLFQRRPPPHEGVEGPPGVVAGLIQINSQPVHGVFDLPVGPPARPQLTDALAKLRPVGLWILGIVQDEPLDLKRRMSQR